MRILFKKKNADTHADTHEKTRRFLGVSLAEKYGPIKNPARGFYHMYTFVLKQDGVDGPEPEWLETMLDPEESLVLVMIDIGVYRGKNLDNAGLDSIQKILEFFHDRHKDVILRIVYDHQGKGLEREPLAFEQVRRHLFQIGPFLSGRYGVFIYQGMLVGSWGEMHTSRFLSPAHLVKMSGILQEYCSEGTFFSVRKPSQWRTISPDKKYGHGQPSISAGLYDDAMFASATHLGTFGTEENEKNQMVSWTADREQAFEEKICKYVPHGGEAVFSEGYTETLSGEQMLSFLRQCHVTYLNKDYDARIMQRWSSIPWAEGSLYDYIDRHLGYRFVIRKVLAGGGNRLEILIENTGFANIYQEAELYLENGTQKYLLPEDMRTWDSGTTKRVVLNHEMTEGEIFLAARRKSDGAVIHFANEDDAQGRVLLGRIVRLEEEH